MNANSPLAFDHGSPPPRRARRNRPDPSPLRSLPRFIPRNEAALTAGVLALALLPRLAFLLFSNPENPGDGPYVDVFQHWQIGYLTQQIGLSHGFRLWDLKGVEYFWSTLHPLLLAVLFAVFHTADVVVPRMVSIVAGSVSVVLLFYLCRRYWSLPVALGAAIFAALSPISVFNDASGMLEPLAVMLMLAGISLVARHPFWAGVVWALASAVRPEAWLFSAGLIVAAFIRRDSTRSLRPLAYGWPLVMAAQMAFLWLRTGNPVYPFYWNFLANAGGKWIANPTATQLAMRPIFIVLWLAATAGLALTLWRRPPSHLLLTYGFGYTALVLGLFAFTPFLSNWDGSWGWMMWVLAFPYDFVALLVIVGVAYFARSRRPDFRRTAADIAVLAAVTSLLWFPVAGVYASTTPAWDVTKGAGQYIGGLYQAAGGRGGLNLPPDRPDIDYALVRYGGVSGKALVSQLYDPRYYLAAMGAGVGRLCQHRAGLAGHSGSGSVHRQPLSSGGRSWRVEPAARSSRSRLHARPLWARIRQGAGQPALRPALLPPCRLANAAKPGRNGSAVWLLACRDALEHPRCQHHQCRLRSPAGRRASLV